ncbi:hypothetical protein Hanom_Chr08g00729511 [Helianthus anomalus]
MASVGNTGVSSFHHPYPKAVECYSPPLKHSRSNSNLHDSPHDDEPVQHNQRAFDSSFLVGTHTIATIPVARSSIVSLLHTPLYFDPTLLFEMNSSFYMRDADLDMDLWAHFSLNDRTLFLHH